jgi:hypothetical protein
MPIREVVVPRRIEVGISTDTQAGFVSEYEIREAAHYTGHNSLEWSLLESSEQAACVAHYRMHLLIESHVNEAIHKHSERERRKPRGG